MKTKFTNGPWFLMPISGSYKICTTDGEEFVRDTHYLAGTPFVCHVNDDFGTRETHEKKKRDHHYKPVRDDRLVLANANLISSAPDLYAACESAVEYLIARNLGENAVTLRNKICAALAKARGETP